MTAGDAQVSDLLDNLHHEMYSLIHNHCVYKSVWLPVIEEQLILEKSLQANLHIEFSMAVINDSQIVGHIPSERLFTDHLVFFTQRGSRCRLSYYWENEESKMLKSIM